MNTENNFYPAGSIEYSFTMYAAYDRPISCSIHNPQVRELILEKLNLSDVYDPHWKLTINTGPIQSVEEVDNIGNVVKNDILDTLAFTLNTNISEITQTGHNLTPRPGEGGIFHVIMPHLTFSAIAVRGCDRMSDNSAHEVQVALSNLSGSQSNPLISLYRYAIGIEDPILQFLMFYLIIYDICGNQKQKYVDDRILKIAPDTATTEHTQIIKGTPKTNRETIYTRLRNEINHRASVSPDDTRKEIINNLDCFRSIVYKILLSEALKSPIMPHTEIMS